MQGYHWGFLLILAIVVWGVRGLYDGAGFVGVMNG